MPSSSSLLAFSAASFALIVVPGPSVLFVVSRALTLGRRAALLTVAGNAAGAYGRALALDAGRLDAAVNQARLLAPAQPSRAAPGLRRVLALLPAAARWREQVATNVG